MGAKCPQGAFRYPSGGRTVLSNEKILTDEQVQAFITSLANVRRDKGFEEADAQAVVDWAAGVVVTYTMFQSVLNGDMYIDYVDGEVVFGLTTQGEQYARSITFGRGLGGPPNH